MDSTDGDRENLVFNHSNSFISSLSLKKTKDAIITNHKKYSSIQWITLLTLAFGNFCIGACVSLQAPFFPKEAEKKGATPTEYGLIFGAYQLTIFIMAPIMGKLLAYASPKYFLNAGILTVGTTCILFGTLDYTVGRVQFVSLAFVIRIIEGAGAASLRTSCYTIIAAQFTGKISTIFATLETFLGIGLIIGPTLGGALYDVGGYGLPFFVMGALVLLDAVVIFAFLPKPERKEEEKKGNLLKFWLNLGTLLHSFIIFTVFNYIGFIAAVLEPHLRIFELSGLLLGMIFAINGTVYAITSPIWGWICDKKVSKNLVSFIGCLITTASLFFIGPLPFLPFQPMLEVVIPALVLMGIGASAKLISTFGGSVDDAMARGFPSDITTFGLISSMFASSQSLGAFVGPSLGGYLLDIIGFRYATVILFCMEILLIIFLVIYVSAKRIKKPGQALAEEEEPILNNSSCKAPNYT